MKDYKIGNSIVSIFKGITIQPKKLYTGDQK